MAKRILSFLKSEKVFFFGLFTLIIFLFKNAFSIRFFQDDYFFNIVSKADSLKDFLNFFSPIRTYSFKPIPTEVFYFIIKLFNNSPLISHIIVFATFFIGLYFLYKIVNELTKNKLLSRLTLFIYSISFIHVFQLYWLATYQEVLLFTSLCASFYFYIKKRIPLSIFLFIIALLSKETAILYMVFLVFFELISTTKEKRQINRSIIIYILVSLIFYFIYRYSLSHVMALPNNKINISNIRLLINNSMWYFLWSIGIPNFVPNFLKSIFSPPLPIFVEYWKQPDFRIYSYLYIFQQSVFVLSVITLILKKRLSLKTLISYILFSVISFFIFLGPLLFSYHRWMIRLTVPLIFISLVFALVIDRLLKTGSKFRWVGFLYIFLYLMTSYFGMRLHESSSLYLLENKISQRAAAYFTKNKQTILKHKTIYFIDMRSKTGQMGNHSITLKNSFFDQNFLDYYFPGKKLKAYYNFESLKIPEDSYIINAASFIE